MTEKYVHTIKSDEDTEERHTSEYIGSRHLDVVVVYKEHGTQKIRCESVYITLLAAKMKSFCLSAVDVKLSYLLFDKLLTKNVFIPDPAH